MTDAHAFVVGALVGVVVFTAATTSALPEDEPLGQSGTMITRAEADGILSQAFAAPTPWEFDVLEISSAGNIAFPGRPVGVFVAGEAPELVVPPRCRADFHRLPRGASLVCMPDDDMIVRARGLFP